MNMVGMAAVAVAIALIIFQIKSGQGQVVQPAVATSATDIASDDEWED